MLHDALHLTMHNADITCIVRSTQFWFEHTVHLRVLHVSAYCCHHQVQGLLHSPIILSATPPNAGHCLQIWSVFTGYVDFVMPLFYKIYQILTFNF